MRLDSYGEGRVGPVGTVVKVLGSLSDSGVDILAVAHGFGLSSDFPPAVTAAAQEAAERGMEEITEEWVDRTDMLVFTIDPADAEDHDDALSLTELGAGRFEVGVHIADVSHFVPEGGAIDVEALARGTSVYLVDRTIPMLPEALSADVCSLRGESTDSPYRSSSSSTRRAKSMDVDTNGHGYDAPTGCRMSRSRRYWMVWARPRRPSTRQS